MEQGGRERPAWEGGVGEWWWDDGGGDGGGAGMGAAESLGLVPRGKREVVSPRCSGPGEAPSSGRGLAVPPEAPAFLTTQQGFLVHGGQGHPSDSLYIRRSAVPVREPVLRGWGGGLPNLVLGPLAQLQGCCFFWRRWDGPGLPGFQWLRQLVSPHRAQSTSGRDQAQRRGSGGLAELQMCTCVWVCVQV